MRFTYTSMRIWSVSPKALFRRSRRRFSTCETPPGVLQVVNLEVFQVGKSPRFSTWKTSLTEQLFSCARIALWGYRGVRKLPEIAPAQNNYLFDLYIIKRETLCKAPWQTAANMIFYICLLIECVNSAPIREGCTAEKSCSFFFAKPLDKLPKIWYHARARVIIRARKYQILILRHTTVTF